MWEEAEKQLSKDKFIGPLLKKYGKCQIKKRPKGLYFDNIASSIIEQQLSGKAAATIYKRVLAVSSNGKKLTPEGLFETDDQKLRDCGMSWAKVKYVKDLAGKVNDGTIQITKLDKLSDEEIIRRLIQVKGIGRWTAEMFLMFTLARPDIFPVDDLGIKKGLRLCLWPGGRASFRDRNHFGLESGSERFKKAKNDSEEKVEMAKFAEKHWKPFRTVASWYLWKSLEN